MTLTRTAAASGLAAALLLAAQAATAQIPRRSGSPSCDQHPHPPRAQGASTQGVVQAGSATSPGADEGALAWTPYSAEALEAQRDSGRIVLVDFTADWCLTCKVNDHVAFASEAVRVALRDHDVALLRADWTTRDPVVTRALAAFGRTSVPFVVIYPRARDAAPIILPTLLTSGIVTGALERAVASPSGVQTSAALTSGRIAPSPSLEANP